MKMRWIVSAVALLSTAAIAGDMKPEAFKSLDADGDGRITSTEAGANAKLTEAFKTADANGDGWISSAEYDTWMKSHASKADKPKTSY